MMCIIDKMKICKSKQCNYSNNEENNCGDVKCNLDIRCYSYPILKQFDLTYKVYSFSKTNLESQLYSIIKDYKRLI